MIDKWKNMFVLISNSRNEFLTLHDESDKSIFEFVNQYLLQLIVLWVLQKRSFFNSDKNYFLNMFQLIENNDPDIPFRTYSDFINSLLDKLSSLNDNHMCEDSRLGKLRGCKSAVFLNISFLSKNTDFPNEYFFFSPGPRSPVRVNSKPSGVLYLLDQIEFDINGVFLGSLYEWLMSSKKKRKIGVYYSPEELTTYISRYSLRILLMDKMGANYEYSQHSWSTFFESLDESGLLRLYENLKDLTILDPAVGTGQFLESAVDELLLLYSSIVTKTREFNKSLSLEINIEFQNNEKVIDLTKVTDQYELEFYLMNSIIFPKTLYGVDIDPLVIPFTIARFFIYITQKMTKSTMKVSFSSNFICNLITGDALLLDWENFSFPTLEKPKYFSLVLTNPPYIGESDNKELFRRYAGIHPNYYEGKIDIWYLFLHLAITLTQPRGIVSFLATNYWLTASGASKLRKRLFEETFIMEFIDFGDNRLFEGVHGIHSSILTIKNLTLKNPSINCIFFTNKIPPRFKLLDIISQQLTFQIDQKNLTLNRWDDYFHFIPPDVSLVMKAITRNSYPIKNSSYMVNEGLITGLNKITKRLIDKYDYPPTWINRGIFIFDLDNIDDQKTIESFTSKEKEYLRPLYKSSSIKNYSTRIQTNQRILYLVRNEIDLATTPNIKKHLDHYQIATQNSLDSPPYINRPRKKEMFLSPKLITPQRARRTHFAYNSTEWFAAQDVYFIREKSDSVLNLKVLLILLQSKLSFYWFSWMGKKKGSQLEFFGESLSNFPIPKIMNIKILLSRIADYLIFLNSLDKTPEDFQEILNFFVERIANVIVYKSYFNDAYLTTPVRNQLFEDVCSSLLCSMKEIDVKQFLDLRYSIFSSANVLTSKKTEYNDLADFILLEIQESYQIILKDERIAKLNNERMTNPIIKQIDDFAKQKWSSTYR